MLGVGQKRKSMEGTSTYIWMWYRKLWKGHSPTYHSLMSIHFCIQTLMASSWWPHPWQILPSGSAPQIAQALCKLEEHPNRCQACLHTLGEIPTTWNISNKDMIQQRKKGTRWLSWLRHCATSRKVTGLIHDGITGIFHWHNPSGHTKALALTQPLTEMSTRSISWG